MYTIWLNQGGLFIKQIKHIGSVGRFRACTPEGDVTFKKFTLIFGENGRGKTTLCSILRSLQTGNPDIIIGRKTLGDGKDPNVVLLLEYGNALFNKGTWNSPQSRLCIFDAQYVADNIYMGDEIGADQRRNLCHVILGKDGVALANDYHRFDAEITAKNSAIRDAKRLLTTHVPATRLDDFLQLKEDPEIEKQIDAKRKEVEGLKDIDNLRSQSLVEKIEFPPLPTRLVDILGRTLEDVSRDAEAAVRAHLKVHGMVGNEIWLSTGLMHLSKDECPFCGQSTKGLDLIDAYKAYFNATYTAFRRDLDAYQQLPGKHYSDDRIELIRSKIQANATHVEVWKRYVAFDSPSIPGSLDAIALLTKFRAEMVALLEQKAASPLEIVKASGAYKDAYTSVATLSEAVSTYNEEVERANAKINAFKTAASPARLQSSSNELKWLELTKKRREPAIVDACDRYVALNAEKDTLEEQKVQARARLDGYSGRVVENYRNAINRLLKRFNAGFHLERVRVEYSGRVANSTFCVVINATMVEMGTSDTPLNEPSFKNTLSAGDRSTLALAFFLAEIEADPSKSQCTIVFDDPFNSQDHFRRTCTATEIRRCGDSVAQVIVMSHERGFLRDFWDLPLPTAERKALWLIPCGHKETIIAEWPIETDSESDDAAHRRTLLGYYHHNRGEVRDVIQKLRPVLETHMQRVAPHLLTKVNGLGNMLAKIREPGSPQILVEAYDDIDDVNTYTRRYMHGEGRRPDSEPVHATELHGFVGKVLEICGALTDS
jgi:wobble nucleotide-excising tRNase